VKVPAGVISSEQERTMSSRLVDRLRIPASSYRDREAIQVISTVPALNKISVSVGRRLPAGESCRVVYNALHDTS
jgi:hypothetical protein